MILCLFKFSGSVRVGVVSLPRGDFSNNELVLMTFGAKCCGLLRARLSAVLLGVVVCCLTVSTSQWYAID